MGVVDKVTVASNQTDAEKVVTRERKDSLKTAASFAEKQTVESSITCSNAR